MRVAGRLFLHPDARRGHEITGVDYSEAMIECARENVENHSPEASAYFSQMDAQNLTFEDDTFDVVLSRNLTWNLEHPDRAYAEWLRVLRPGGVLLNFDATGTLICSTRSLPGCMRKMPKRCVLWGMPWRMNTETRSWTS